MTEFSHALFPHPLHQFAEDILVNSFPEEERPDIETLRRRDTSMFHFDVITQDKRPVGILTYWDFPDFTYIEHFAIEATLRNHRIGSEALTKFMKRKGTIALEAEPPESPLAIRRLNFYQRHGLSPVPFEYTQPNYREGERALPLIILSNKQISHPEFEKIKNTLYREVYKVLP